MRPEPRTYNRAATALVQGRRLLEKARQELLLALDILVGLDPGEGRTAYPGVTRLLRVVEEELTRLDVSSDGGGGRGAEA